MCIRSRYLFLLLATILGVGSAISLAQGQALSMGGGFVGGTFNVFVGGIGSIVGEQLPALRIEPAVSAGSVENLHRIMAGELDMAVAFAGDAYLAHNGFELFDDDEAHPVGVRAIGFLYPAVSQLVTLPTSNIRTLGDLSGKRVAVAEPGSGTHMAIQRLLSQVGLLDEVTFVFVGGENASRMLKAGEVDAYHALLGVPNATVLDTVADREVVILDTLDVALRAGFFDRYPFYLPVVIPGGTYPGVDQDVLTWKDSALWVVRADLDEELVYQMTSAVFGAAGVAQMRAVTSVAGEMGVATALRGVALPVHAGAARFWVESGLELPAIARPVQP